ncbi:MAG: hypothetical protein AAGF77_07540 [Bacteroidota bacterium]
MKSTLICLIILFAALSAEGQVALDWSDLERGISWRKSNAHTTIPGFLEADFSDKLTNLEGKKISLVGYLLILDANQSVFMLSKNPMASCFFCGNGGPETVSEISFTQKNKFVMDDLILVTGILRLNGKDPTRCYYHIENAEGFGM